MYEPMNYKCKPNIYISYFKKEETLHTRIKCVTMEVSFFQAGGLELTLSRFVIWWYNRLATVFININSTGTVNSNEALYICHIAAVNLTRIVFTTIVGRSYIQIKVFHMTLIWMTFQILRKLIYLQSNWHCQN